MSFDLFLFITWSCCIELLVTATTLKPSVIPTSRPSFKLPAIPAHNPFGVSATKTHSHSLNLTSDYIYLNNVYKYVILVNRKFLGKYKISKILLKFACLIFLYRTRHSNTNGRFTRNQSY